MRILEPGTFLHAVPVKPGPITVMERAEAEVPCRTHLSVLDMRRFEPGVPGGGGIGHAIDLRARAVVRVADEWTVRSSRPHVVEHAARVVAGAAGYGGALEVEAEDHGIRHLGLGSTSALMTAVAVAVNHVLGRPLGSRDLRHIIGRNFVEDHPEGVVPGFETGVGPAVGLYGGFIVMTDALAIASRMSLPDGWQAVIAVVHGDPRKSSGEEEISLLMNRARDLDASAAERKAHLALLDLIPAMDAGDLDRMTGVIARLQRIGSKVAEIEHHPRPDGIRSLAESMRDAGARLVGMSSVGPSVTGIVS
ncbi:MAG TPA: GHMP kinase, partial [Thermoplasmata archaeon]|nr:GHMP kinase [Thermoplasmata archaeon]